MDSFESLLKSGEEHGLLAVGAGGNHADFRAAFALLEA